MGSGGFLRFDGFIIAGNCDLVMNKRARFFKQAVKKSDWGLKKAL
jgi:hypothetical protein